MVVRVQVPDLSRLVDQVVERTVERAVIEVENSARLTAPVDTGFYRNNITRNIRASTVTATAEYSAAIEYGVGGTRRRPNPVLRNAARDVQRQIPEIFRRIFRSV